MMEVPYHYQFRIIVIGDTMVGKSSLLKTFSEGTFGDIEPTVGVDFFSKLIEIRARNNNEQNNHKQSTRQLASKGHNNISDDKIIVKLQIWDTAGQERFKSIVTSYYRNSIGIVLVYDVTNKESYDHLIDWFREARRHTEPAPSPSLSPLTHNPPPSLLNVQPKSLGSQNYPLTSTPQKRLISNLNSSNADTNSTTNLFFNASNDDLNSRPNKDNYKMSYLVLGCKTDLESQRQVSYEDGKAFADYYGFKFIETSSKTHYNVDKAFQLLAEEIYEKISDLGRANRLHRSASGCHLMFDGTSSQVNEGIRIGPLLESNSKRYSKSERIRLLEAQPVSGFMGGCC